MKITHVCIFAGAKAGSRHDYRRAAESLADELAARDLGIVYGGGRVGLMGVLADAALSAGVEVIGVIPQGLSTRELAHPGLPDLRVVASMHERKALMGELAQAFVALPGGLGTLEELFEVLTWAQLGIHDKPCGLLNVAGYFDDLLRFLRHSAREQFLHQADESLLVVEQESSRLIDELVAFEPPQLKKWLDSGQT